MDILSDKKIFELQAEVCKTFANPKRLEILYLLKEGELTVGALVKKLNLPKANVSQHLATLRRRGVVVARREGVNIFYHVANQKIMQACGLMREVLVDQAEENRRLLDFVKEKD